jgi:hypothetical protein
MKAFRSIVQCCIQLRLDYIFLEFNLNNDNGRAEFSTEF